MKTRIHRCAVVLGLMATAGGLSAQSSGTWGAWQAIGDFPTQGMSTLTVTSATSPSGLPLSFDLSSDCTWCGTSADCFALVVTRVEAQEHTSAGGALDGLRLRFSYLSGASSAHWRNVASPGWSPCFQAPPGGWDCNGWGFQGAYPVVGQDVFEFAPPVSAAATVRAGNPPNPVVLLAGTPSGPVLGSAWTPRIDHTSFAKTALLDLVAVDLGPPVNVPISYGTLLCVPPPAGQIFSAPPDQAFAIPVPLDCSFLGRSACAQGLSVSRGPRLELTNALDLVFGNQ